MRPDGLGKLKKVNSSCLEPMFFRPVGSALTTTLSRAHAVLIVYSNYIRYAN
jgi:hypothetical protein